MKKRKIEVIQTSCKRCGKPLCTISKAIHYTEEMRKRLSGICENCLTPQEKEELRNAVPNLVRR